MLMKLKILLLMFVLAVSVSVVYATVTCNNCNVNSCQCTVSDCSAGVLRVYETSSCSGVHTLSKPFNSSSVTWDPLQPGTSYVRAFCDNGVLSACSSVAVSSGTTGTPGTTINVVSTSTITTQVNMQPIISDLEELQSDLRSIRIDVEDIATELEENGDPRYVRYNSIVDDLVESEDLIDEIINQINIAPTSATNRQEVVSLLISLKNNIQSIINSI
jgi:hypothetical protein